MRDILRVMTCGSVDDGKSTLLGRLLFDAGLLHDDQSAQLDRDNARHGNAGADAIDYALLLDGLEAEREQGITIDVAYRFADTQNRRLVIADSPGHAQYTRNMATAASVSDLAIVLVDATRGVLTQTRRHSTIAGLMGIRQIVLAVNKMDLIGFDQHRFNDILRDYTQMTADFGFAAITAIPLSARDGDNVTRRSTKTGWYTGPTLLDHLDRVKIELPVAQPFRMPVQWVNRPDAHFRGYAGTLASGQVRVGDPVVVSSSDQQSRVARIVTALGEADQAGPGDAVTLVLADELDISRGAVLAAADQPVAVSDQFSAHLIWLSETPMPPGRAVLFTFGTHTVAGTISRLRHRIDVETGTEAPADTLVLNDVARVQIATDTPVAYAPYAENRELGGFIVIDRLSNATIGVGMVEHALTRANNLRWQELDITRERRAAIKGQRPAVLWFTGLSGAGKSTIANMVERRLHALGRHTMLLDGDNLRHGLNRDLGFTEADRVENIRRVGEVAALFAEAGIITLVSFISPYRAERDAARQRLPAGAFLEIFVDTPIDECRRRDPKGLYEKADAGKIANFTGVSAPYEAPLTPELHLRTTELPLETLAEQVVALLQTRGVIA